MNNEYRTRNNECRRNYFIIRCSLFIIRYSFLLFSCSVIEAQNLVPNPSFEIYDTCPNYYNQAYYAIPWFQPATFMGNVINSCSSEYFNSCSSNPNISVPTNFGGFQYARTGNGYAGIGLYATNETREYLEVMLTDTLEAEKKYNVEYYVSLTYPYNIAIDNFHFYFSNDSLLSDTTFLHAIRVTPSVVNQLGVFITDTSEWVKVSGVYIATGGERYLTIGNFYDNAHTDTINDGSSAGMSAYYYVDDVSVSLDSTTAISEIPNQTSQIQITPNPFHNSFILHTPLSLIHSQISIYNSLGDIVHRQIINQESEIINLNVAAGVYFLKIEGNPVFTQKLVVY